MINKRSYNNPLNIVKDKEKFRELALNEGYNLIDIEDFITDFYQNLKGFKWNLKELKGGLKE